MHKFNLYYIPAGQEVCYLTKLGIFSDRNEALNFLVNTYDDYEQHTYIFTNVCDNPEMASRIHPFNL